MTISKADVIACKIQRDAASGRYALLIINDTEESIVKGSVLWSVHDSPQKVIALAQTRVVPGAAAVVADVDAPGRCTTWLIRRIGVDVDEE